MPAGASAVATPRAAVGNSNAAVRASFGRRTAAAVFTPAALAGFPRWLLPEQLYH